MDEPFDGRRAAIAVTTLVMLLAAIGFMAWTLVALFGAPHESAFVRPLIAGLVCYGGAIVLYREGTGTWPWHKPEAGD